MTKKPFCSFFGVLPEMKDYLRNKMSDFHVSISTDPLDKAKKIDPQTEVLGVFVESQVNKKIISKLPRLKLIAAMSTGYDHVDLKEAKHRKIPVCNVPTYGENTVAQHAMALILAVSRKIFQSIERVKQGVFDFHGLRGFDLKGKTIGIIGTGHIGIHLIRMFDGFDAKIIAYDAFPKKELENRYNFKYTTFNKLLAESDVISLHAPLLPQTYHMINKKNIKRIKKGAYIINTARGALIDPEALVWGLETGQIAGAGLDVLEDEGFIQNPEKLISSECKTHSMKTSLMNNIIIDHPNTIITPHNAFNSIEALYRIIDTTVENIRSFYKGKTQNDVTQPKKK